MIFYFQQPFCHQNNKKQGPKIVELWLDNRAFSWFLKNQAYVLLGKGFEPESGEFMVLFWTISFAQHCISKINYNSSLAQQQRYKKLIRTFWFKANFWFQSSSSKTLFCNFRSSVGILKWLKRGRLVRAERIQIWIGGRYYKTTFLAMNWTEAGFLKGQT